jgi:hypothetical protein
LANDWERKVGFGTAMPFISEIEAELDLAQHHLQEATVRMERQRQAVRDMLPFAAKERVALAREALRRLETALSQMLQHIRDVEERLAAALNDDYEHH